MLKNSKMRSNGDMDGNDNMLIVGLNDEDFLLGLFGAREKKKWGVRD